MTIHINSFFAVGQTHNICQDYAAANMSDIFADEEQPKLGELSSEPTLSTLAISDGCSSSPDTDIGSRLLVRHCLEVFKFGIMSDADVIQSAFETNKRLGLPTTALDATLMVAQLDSFIDLATVNIWGDGVVWLKYKDGTTQTIDIEFPDNTPAYLSYILSPTRMRSYRENHGVRKITQTTDGSAPVIRFENTQEAYGWKKEFCLSSVESMMIFSDGIKSFRRKVNGAYQDVPLAEVLKEVTAIKNHNGEFIVRRMKKFLHDFCVKNNWIHEDDVSVAAMINEVK